MLINLTQIQYKTKNEVKIIAVYNNVQQPCFVNIEHVIQVIKFPTNKGFFLIYSPITGITHIDPIISCKPLLVISASATTATRDIKTATVHPTERFGRKGIHYNITPIQYSSCNFYNCENDSSPTKNWDQSLL